jgi:hypothetical protein
MSDRHQLLSDDERVKEKKQSMSDRHQLLSDDKRMKEKAVDGRSSPGAER